MKPNKWQRKYIKQQNDKMPRRLQEIPRELWPENSPAGILRVLRSRFFLVQVYQAAEPALVRLTVNKTTYDGKTYVDGISWESFKRSSVTVVTLKTMRLRFSRTIETLSTSPICVTCG